VTTQKTTKKDDQKESAAVKNQKDQARHGVSYKKEDKCRKKRADQQGDGHMTDLMHESFRHLVQGISVKDEKQTAHREKQKEKGRIVPHQDIHTECGLIPKKKTDNKRKRYRNPVTEHQ